MPVCEETGVARTMGIAFVPDGDLYICDNQGRSGQTELDEPGEPIIWNGKIIVSCFDTVTNDIVINTAHELPATLAQID